MNPFIKNMLAGAVSGFMSALIVDINAWAKSDETFNWKLAIKRWIAGAIAGVSGGTIIGASVPNE